MKLLLTDDLPFITITIAYQGNVTDIPDVLIDTGSASTILEADMVSPIGIIPSYDDMPYTIRGIGGTELVISRRLDYIKIGEHSLSDFEVEIGGMDYGFEINGIIGMDFMTLSGAIINLRELTIEFE